jgi:peptidoglycan/xylan/chitin deacetylase (PgdA/CDA1 family)
MIAVAAGLLAGTLAALLPIGVKPRRRSRSRSRWMARVIRGVVGGSISTVLVVVPSAIFVRESLGKSAHQLAVPQVRLPPTALAAYKQLRPYRGAVPVLTYHDVSENASGSRYTVTAVEFARQMAMLRAAGFTSITAAQFERFAAGTGRLPEKPILITFDDGPSSAWRVADPIIARYKMHAVMFVITGEIGKHAPYYLTDRQLRSLRDSGRWDFEAHTDNGHHAILTSPGGKRGPFLTNREWLQSEDRYETLSEFESRVASDLDRCIARLRALGADPQMFAYPFSAANTPTNDHRVVPILHRLVRARFPISLVDSAQHRYVSRSISMRGELPRFLVTATTTARDLFDDLAENEVLPQPGNLVSTGTSWVVDQDDLESAVREHKGLRFAPPSATWMSVRWKPANALPVHDATLHVLAAKLGSPDAGSALTLVVRPDGNDVPATVTVGPASLRVRAATSLECKLARSPSHRLEVAYRGNTLRVAVDGRRAGIVRLATADGTGIGLGAWRDEPASPRPVVRKLLRGGTIAAFRRKGKALVCTSQNGSETPSAHGGRAHPGQTHSTHRNNASSRTSSRSTRRTP